MTPHTRVCNRKKPSQTIVSTADAFLNIGGAAIVHDIPLAFGISIPLNIDSGAVARLVSIVLFISVSLLTPRPVAAQTDA